MKDNNYDYYNNTKVINTLINYTNKVTLYYTKYTILH